jgi:hypothetical protein
MARVTGMLPSAERACTTLASCPAPIQTNRATKTSSGLVKRPMKPKTSAIAWPSVAAMWVAWVYSSRVASSARTARPPSMGKAGIRLKSASERLMESSRPRNELSPSRARLKELHAPVASNPTTSNAAMAKFTAGPASATHSSCRGSSGMRSSRATPPMGNSVISRVLMP